MNGSLKFVAGRLVVGALTAGALTFGAQSHSGTNAPQHSLTALGSIALSASAFGTIHESRTLRGGATAQISISALPAAASSSNATSSSRPNGNNVRLVGVSGACNTYWTLAITVQTSYDFNTEGMSTVNYLRNCYYAWNHSISPFNNTDYAWLADTHSHFGDYTHQLTDWDNQTVFPAQHFYFRVWIDQYGNVSWYAGQ